MTVPRWPRFVIPVVIIIVALAILISVTAGIWTDFLWYSSVGKTRVFATAYSVKWLLFLVTAVIMTVIIGTNVVLAYRMRPEEPPSGPEHQGVEAYRQAIDPHRRAVLIVLLGLIGLISGLAAASNWQTWLLFVDRVPFGVKDPAVPSGYFVLHQCLSVLADGAVILVRRGAAVARAVRRSARAVWRPPAGQARAAVARRPGRTCSC